MPTPALGASVTERLTPRQIRSFWAAWLGWTLDGMDSFLYALVLVPALRELLPASGLAATPANTGYYGGLLFAVFLIGWGMAFLWGPLGDRFGRVRTMMATIVCYSLFTFLGCFAQNVWQLGAFRLLAGLGIGGEWTLGGILVAEEWPASRRKQGTSWMHTGYYFGTLLAAALNYWLGAKYGWRVMFAVGGAPALLVAFIRYGVQEPERWQHRTRVLSAWAAFFELFSREYRSRTWLNALFVLVSMIGLWAGSVYVPSSVTELARKAGWTAGDATRLASTATIMLSAATIVGCFLVPALADRIGRRGTLGFFFAIMMVSIAVGFGYLFYQPGGLYPFIACLVVLGFGGANFGVYTLWLPEQYRTECRASAFAFATSAGRFVAAGATSLVGWGISRYGSIGVPVACTAVAFALGILLLPFGVETKDKEMPE